MAEDARERVRLANERMGIAAACRFIGMHMGDFDIYSVKTYCPFGELMHEDGGRSKAFRVYPGTNSAWCFACNQYYTPVKLVAFDRDIPEPAAAEIILEEVGYVAPDIESRWAAATAQTASVDTDGMANALKTYCARIAPDWEVRQFDDDIASMLRRCLAPLSKVTNDEEARQWLDTTKLVMHKALSAPRKETV